MMRATLRNDERGASLVIVLVLTATFGLIAAGLAAQGEAGVLSAQGARIQRVDQYAATGAVNGAIAALRGDITKGREGVSCPNYHDPTNRVVVTCTPQSGSGQFSTTAVNIPAQALLTTRGPSGYGTGVGLSTSGNNALLINGPVYANSTIAVSKLNVPGSTVGAFGACTGTITAASVVCNTGATSADPGGNATTDPAPGNAWASSIQTMPATAPAPVCSGTTDVATMQPGAYFSQSALVAGIGGCSITYMQPGGYYFDFDASNTLWTISNKTIGGTAKGWNPNAANQSPSVPGACYTNDAAHPAGVELVFAGASRLSVTGSGALELCPTVNNSAHEIVLSGRKAASPPTPVVTTLTPSGVTAAAPASMGTPAANLLTIDTLVNTPPTGTGITGKLATASVTLTGYSLSGIPSGSTITSVQALVAHGEDGQVPTFGVAVTAGATNLCTNASTGWGASSALVTSSVTCAPNVVWNGSATAQLVYTLTRPNNGASSNVRLDGARLVVTYTPPPLQPTTLGTTVLSGSSNKLKIYLWGTVYEPFAGFDLDFKNKSETSFGRGAVLNFLTTKGVPPSQTFAPFDLPTTGGAYADRDVVLVATLNGKTWVKARVQFDDLGGSAPGSTVKVQTWSSVL